MTTSDRGWRSSYWSDWTRNNLPDSHYKFFVSDFDGIVANDGNRRFGLVEVKQYERLVGMWQHELYARIASYIVEGMKSTHLHTFEGVFFLRFEREGFHDGWCKIHTLASTRERLITEGELIDLLSFNKKK